jgi:hypothetical protein
MNKKMFDMVVTDARKFAIKEILPVNEEGDRVGLTLENNMVLTEPEAGSDVGNLITSAKKMMMAPIRLPEIRYLLQTASTISPKISSTRCWPG